ncbi:GNAT family N-acetyltransferase [Boseongicola aestuarii]|uniref:Ribosomal-protein-S5-alanine N-acetyltransferase n=1 Tax=Boseongicola aestuarii TaxID=1470561 RepID=A0A238J1T0_9RHOB|nr:GNAT family N-acetyltransferase [Boseongicola aestuarii]SMX24283.1 ribosomal-protein-S5-alanine N-acetyltransferase [Boseongicola aestuarii]
MTRQAPPVLRTPRLTLRPLEMTDADALVQGVGNYDVSRWLSVVPYPYTQEDALWFLEKTIDDNALVWGICDDGGFRGVIGIDDGLGYWLARPAWRKGYGFEAAFAVVEHWFEDEGRSSLASTYFEGNDRSGAVLDALGFQPIGHTMRNARSLNQDVGATEMELTRANWSARTEFTVYTPRLTMRPWKDGDAEALLALITPGLTRGVSSIGNDWTLEDAKASIAERQWRGLTGFILAIEHDGALIGGIGCGGYPVALMYYLGETYWNRGFASEAVSAFVPELFQRFPMTKLVADHFDDNPASGRVLQKHGFCVTGEAMGASKGRLEPCRVITYAVTRDSFKVAS